ncbi:dihydrofolate reductase [Chitinophaga dinghuensis]|uniref:Dihydrofolate reductase n=1 Tax=Chitinophaga dinghuensis TaxID=1539050 RepID=A0A327VI22_9BACT|nr:dihydrofolate reductase family protein [Chitinophaga dinghuensis]RAJ73726.1 dihydrofolate reductase [Chitinophaga dinghuensis]
MKKVILNIAVTLDGFIEGPNGEVDWCIMDDDMDFGGFLASVDTIFYGRVSYDAWGSFQPDMNAAPVEKEMWEGIHAKDKYVFSRQNREHAHVTFVHTDIINQVNAVKQRGGKDIWLYGGARLIKTFIQAGLIDVYRIYVHPVALGTGKPLFEGLDARVGLRLTGTRAFRSGVVELTYEPQ